jgi:hypothetical protein
MSTTSTSTNDNKLLDQVIISNKVVQDDQLPIVLFDDGGTWIYFFTEQCMNNIEDVIIAHHFLFSMQRM